MNRAYAMALSAALTASCGPHPLPSDKEWLEQRSRAPHVAIQQGSGDYRSVIWSRNLRPIGDAAVPFATYLNQIHGKLHPVFADIFLADADQLPADDALQNRSLRATVELVIDGESGRIVQKGIFQSSGLPAFDALALASIERAAPYGYAPPAIRSPDGNVYLRWLLRRDRLACSTLGMHPYLLKSAPR
jgi:hypothetical protein